MDCVATTMAVRMNVMELLHGHVKTTLERIYVPHHGGHGRLAGGLLGDP
jgi:hypothetical protein